MRIAPIHELTIFDVAQLTGRTQQTLASLTIDGENVYSKSIMGIRFPNSGTNTVGAYMSDSAVSIFAWIDPISNEFLLTADGGTFQPVMLLPGLVLVSLMFFAKHVGLLPEVPLVQELMLTFAVGALIAVKMKSKEDRKLEIAMRAKLKNL